MLFGKSALEQTFDKFSYFGEEKHIFNEKIINKYKNSTNSDDILAVAIAYLGEGAQYRKEAITCFEHFLKFPSKQSFFSAWYIYSSLATLYEKEYMFREALTCLQILTKLDNKTNCADYTRMGDVLVKIDVDEAIQFYEDLKKDAVYNKFKRVFDNAYEEILLKKEKGYKYKPRKK